ncbi:hypothetical protein QTP88_006629 [Uroleucon formosanum]
MRNLCDLNGKLYGMLQFIRKNGNSGTTLSSLRKMENLVGITNYRHECRFTDSRGQ